MKIKISDFKSEVSDAGRYVGPFFVFGHKSEVRENCQRRLSRIGAHRRVNPPAAGYKCSVRVEDCYKHTLLSANVSNNICGINTYLMNACLFETKNRCTNRFSYFVKHAVLSVHRNGHAAIKLIISS